ncbi:MAG TPA: ATP-binding cassette domain-containing protein, partial [Bacteroidetes bacterium]|nr:ATP-binding cassette domain-containing protein [Bacteroidota bacterium]
MVVFSYKNELTLKNKFNKSTNIIHDKEDCKDYIIMQSTKDTLKTFFKIDYHNSIALIGSFGCGKSSLLLYINTLLAQNKNSESCLKQLKKIDKQLFKMYKIFTKNREFIRIKIVGEHISFKSQFKNAINKHSIFETTQKYLKENELFQMSKALECLDKDLEKSN